MLIALVGLERLELSVYFSIVWLTSRLPGNGRAWLCNGTRSSISRCRLTAWEQNAVWMAGQATSDCSHCRCPWKTGLWRFVFPSLCTGVALASSEQQFRLPDFQNREMITMMIFRPGNGSPSATNVVLVLFVVSAKALSLHNRSSSKFAYTLLTVFSIIAPCRIFKLSFN